MFHCALIYLIAVLLISENMNFILTSGPVAALLHGIGAAKYESGINH